MYLIKTCFSQFISIFIFIDNIQHKKLRYLKREQTALFVRIERKEIQIHELVIKLWWN